MLWNVDRLHLTKGIFGIRIDNVQSVKMEGHIAISNLHNLGEFGDSDLCGRYFTGKNGGHHNQEYPVQIGYTGNEVHGISFVGSSGSFEQSANVVITDLVSARGSSFGLNFYSGNDFAVQQDVRLQLDNIHSGAYLDTQEVHQLEQELLPNTVPRSCALDVWTADDNHIEFDDDALLESRCVSGFGSCSFRYSEIDRSYLKDHDVLNMDHLDGAIDNAHCDYIVGHTENVLDALSARSAFHAETRQLLRAQTSAEEEITVDLTYTVMVICIALCCVAMILLHMRFCYRDPKGDDDDGDKRESEHEQIPLLSHRSL